MKTTNRNIPSKSRELGCRSFVASLVAQDYDTDTYRGVYKVKFKGAVYVLHASQKKSKSGRKTPKPEIELIERRLKIAKEHYEEWSETQKP